MAAVLKVSPEKLNQAATEFANSGKNISSMTSEMMSIVDSLKSIWQGSAATEYSGRFNGRYWYHDSFKIRIKS